MTTVDAWHRKATRWFIDENPIEDGVELRRMQKVATPEGGFRREFLRTLDPQPARLVRSNLRSAEKVGVTDKGRTVAVEATLVLLLGADVSIGDEFDYEDHTWEVLTISGRYATDAGVYRHAS